ncbi:MAG TPA: hypothetical protein VFG76_05355 [Candidatus Polarisedimenticolia bacterium]|nr:hypothetical protein [Candidatus Polarisedimenticolia bacterium]
MTIRSTPAMAITLGLLAAAATVACGSARRLPEGAELIPAGITVTLAVDVPAVLNSDLYKRYETDESFFGRNRQNLYRFAEAAGLDPAKDLRKVIFLVGAGEEGLEDMSAVVTGTFDGAKVHAFLADSGVPSHQVAGIDIFEFIIIDGRCRFCMAVVDGSTAAFGDGETLGKIAEVKKGVTPGLATVEGPARLLTRMGPGPDVWGIVQAGDLKRVLAEMLSQLDARGSQLSKLGPIHEAAFSLELNEPLRVALELTTDSKEDALLVADVLKGAEAVARLALRETKPETARLMSDLMVEADTGLVRVAGSLPGSDIETVVRTLRLSALADRLTQPAEPGSGPSSEASGTPR